MLGRRTPRGPEDLSIVQRTMTHAGWTSAHRCAAVLVAMVAAVRAEAAAPDAAAVEFFETRIRPVLVEHCYECHSAAEASPKGELRLDTAALLLRGGASGRRDRPRQARRKHAAGGAAIRVVRNAAHRASCPTRSSPISKSGSRWAPPTREPASRAPDGNRPGGPGSARPLVAQAAREADAARG